MTDDHLLRFVLESLPPPPARVLEVGAGDGALAADLRARGYDVLAIDPAATDAPGVEAVALLEVAEPDASFDAALAVRSLHHVEPLPESIKHLAEVVRPSGTLVVDEYDVERLDERAARWLIERRGFDRDPAAMVAEVRAHLHPVRRLRHELDRWFALSDGETGPYLYRWDLPPEARAEEEAGIADGTLPATGMRFTGVRS